MPNVCSREHLQKVGAVRTLLAAYSRAEDLIRIGAYQKGSDPTLDRAIAALPQINSFLQQGPDEVTTLGSTITQLMALAS
jgi:flagellum-specific ATP synthase